MCAAIFLVPVVVGRGRSGWCHGLYDRHPAVTDAEQRRTVQCAHRFAISMPVAFSVDCRLYGCVYIVVKHLALSYSRNCQHCHFSTDHWRARGQRQRVVVYVFGNEYKSPSAVYTTGGKQNWNTILIKYKTIIEWIG